jgi:predicted component of type VI protein secretion system
MDDIEERYVLVPSTGQPGTELPDRVVIGRMNTCDIAIQDKSVSREHARLSRLGTGYLLEDLNSTNGTLVNGSRIAEATVVQTGDLLTFGTVEFRLDSMGPPSSGISSPALQQPAPVPYEKDSPVLDGDMEQVMAPGGVTTSAPVAQPEEAPQPLFEGAEPAAETEDAATGPDALEDEIIAATARLSDLVLRLRNQGAGLSSAGATAASDESLGTIRDIVDSVPASPMAPDELQEARDVLAGLTANPKDFDLLMRARDMAPQLTRLVDQYSQVEAVLNAVADALERASVG